MLLFQKVRLLTNMCSAPLDFISMIERQGGDFTAMKLLNPPTTTSGLASGGGATMKRGGALGGAKKPREELNKKKMFEEAQMVRRVKAYLAKMEVISDEDVLMKMSTEVEPPTQQQQQQHFPQLGSNTNTLKPQSSVGSLTAKSGTRGHSPSPSLQSNASSSAASDGRKSSANSQTGNSNNNNGAGGTKFGELL